LADSQNRNTHPKRKPRRISIRLTRNLILYYRKPANRAGDGKHQGDSYTQKIYQRTKNEARLKPIETIGVIVVFAYTVFAGFQSCWTKQSVDQQIAGNRPVMYHNGVDWLDRMPTGSIPTKVIVKVRWKNFGRSLAVTVVPVAHIFVRPSGEKAPFDTDCHDGWRFPKTKRTDAVAPDDSIGDEYKWGLAPGEIKSGEKTLYVSGCVYYYGIDRKQRYTSDLCVKWSATEPQDFPTCAETGRNYATHTKAIANGH